MKHRLLAILLGVAGFISSPLMANWTLNVGYHNPVNAKVGLNLLYWGSQWNFELGLGWVDASLRATDDKDEQNKSNDAAAVAATGDINFKYRLSSGAIAPYIQAGLGASVGASVGDQGGVGANLGGPFIGLGLMFGKPNFYAYAAYNIGSSHDGQVQAGLGVDI